MPDGSRGFDDARVLSTTKKSIRCSIEIKTFDAAQGVLTGIATTPTPDRAKDRLKPMGFRFAKSIPLFLYHDSTKSVGRAFLEKPTKNGIAFRAQLPNVSEEGVLRDRVEEARQMVKYGLIDAVSVGFNPDDGEYKRNELGGIDFDAGEILELSLVPIPMQSEAVITAMKSAYAKSMAAPGRSSTTPRTSIAGAAASKGINMEPLHKQLEVLGAQRAQNVARMAEIDALTEERQLTEDETKEFGELSAALPDLDRKITLKSAQLSQASTAVPVESKGRAPYGFVRKQDPEDKFQGESEMRRILCKVQATIDAREGNFRAPWEIAEQRFGKTHPNLVAVMKTGVAGGGSGSGESLAEFVSADNRYTGDFRDFLYKQTVFDRLPLRSVPANVSIKGIDGAWTAYFVGESKGIPASQGSGSATSTTPLKVAALTVLSNELIRDSSPSALQMARDGLSEAHRQKVDSLFLSATAASSGVSPAGILNGVSALPTAGNTAANALTDLGSLEDVFTLADFEGDLAIVMRKTMGGALGRMRSTLGIYDFPGLTRDGGTLDGKTVYTGGNVGAGDIIMLAPSEIWKIGDMGVTISVSQEAMIEQDTAPTGETDTPAAASATMVSMFQEESTAIKLVRPINWGKRRSFAAQFIGNATYGDATT